MLTLRKPKVFPHIPHHWNHQRHIFYRLGQSTCNSLSNRLISFSRRMACCNETKITRYRRSIASFLLRLLHLLSFFFALPVTGLHFTWSESCLRKAFVPLFKVGFPKEVVFSVTLSVFGLVSFPVCLHDRFLSMSRWLRATTCRSIGLWRGYCYVCMYMCYVWCVPLAQPTTSRVFCVYIS